MPGKRTPGAPRSGRFRADGTATITIIRDRTSSNQTMCRVYNTGANTFQVVVGSSAGLDVLPGCSLDLAAKDNVVVTTSQAIEGIYEYLSADRPIRPGRFRFPAVPAGQRRKIIDHSGGNKSAFYRVVNAGPRAFEIRRGSQAQMDGTLGENLGEVSPRQTLDFQATGGNHQDIYVRNSDTANPQLVEGVYEFLEEG